MPRASATRAWRSRRSTRSASAKDNLSSTFSDAGNNGFNLGYLDAFDPMLDYGYAEFDVRHRLSVIGDLEAAVLQRMHGLTRGAARRLADRTCMFTARSGYPVLGVRLHERRLSSACGRIDPVGIDRNATGGAGHRATRTSSSCST